MRVLVGMALVLISAGGASAAQELGQIGEGVTGRRLGVHVSLPGELGPNGQRMRAFPPFEDPPPTPDQGDVLLTENDLLTIAVPMFAEPGMLGDFGVRFTRRGNELLLEGFRVWSGGITGTLYGPSEYLEPIGSLPGGEYTLTVRKFSVVDFAGTVDFEAFRADPEGYALSQDKALSVAEQTLEFTVVPEPVGVFGLSAMALLVRRGRVGGSVVSS